MSGTQGVVDSTPDIWLYGWISPDMVHVIRTLPGYLTRIKILMKVVFSCFPYFCHRPMDTQLLTQQESKYCVLWRTHSLSWLKLSEVCATVTILLISELPGKFHFFIDKFWWLVFFKKFPDLVFCNNSTVIKVNQAFLCIYISDIQTEVLIYMLITSIT